MKTMKRTTLILMALLLAAATAATTATAFAAPKKKRVVVEQQVSGTVQDTSQAQLRLKTKAAVPDYDFTPPVTIAKPNQ